MAFFPSELPSGPRAVPNADPLRLYLMAAACGAALLLFAHVILLDGPASTRWLPAFALYALGSALAARAFARHYPHATVGLCNSVTQLRLVLVALLVSALISGPGSPWLVPALATAALSLDGIDGWLARREGLVSSVGARFDLEVDSALALTLALGAYLGGTAGVIVLFLGAARYAFLAAGLGLPWLRAPLPERFSRKAVCVLQIATLVALHVPVMPASLAPAATVAMALALVWSFGADVLWLRRHARHPAGAA